MPERNFKCSASSVIPNRKLFAQSFGNKVNYKRSSKFVWIDESFDKDWRLLKSKSGCRTNKIFLEYLLCLAKKELLGNRNENEKSNNLKNKSKHEKYLNKYDSSSQSWSKPLGSHVEKEKENQNGGREVSSRTNKVKSIGSDSNKAPKKYKNCEVKKDTSPRNTRNTEAANTKELALNRVDLRDTNTRLGLSSSLYEPNCDINNVHHIEFDKTETLGTKTKLIFNKNKKTDMNKHSDGLVILKKKQKNKLDSKMCKNLKKPSQTNNSVDVSTTEQVKQVKNICNFHEMKTIQNEENTLNTISETQINNTTISNNNKDLESPVICLAEFSLPSFLILKTIDAKHGLSVFTQSFIKESSQFGPLIGEEIKEKDIGDDLDMKDIWEVQTENKITYISTRNTKTSNWLRFLRPAENKQSANLLTFVKDNCLYFESVRDIQVGEELKYWTYDYYSPWSKKKLEKKSCGGCNIHFTHTLYYRKHCMIFHDPSISLTTRKYHCKICGLAVLGKEKIMKHAAEMHQGKGAYQCQYCLKFFLRLNYLEMHRTYGCAKNPQRSRPLCDLCGRKFCQPQKLKVHIKRMHSDMAVVLRDFQCKNCEKILGSRAALQRHMREVHNKDVVGAFTCDRCGKLFQNKSNLKIHMLTHSGVKPFKCQVTDCSAAFTTKQCLQIHYKKIHGFADEVIPKIERSVAYTFDAYSGGSVSNPEREPSTDGVGSQSTVSQTENSNLEIPLSSPLSSDASNEKTPSSFSSENLKQKYKNSNELGQQKLFDDIKSQNLDESDLVVEPNVQNTKLIFKSKQQLWKTNQIHKTDLNRKPCFRENSNTDLLVEAAIGVAEKDINNMSNSCSDIILENRSKMYTVNQYQTNPSDVGSLEDRKLHFNEKGLDTEMKTFHENKKLFLSKEENEVLKFNSFFRINTSPFPEVQRSLGVPLTSIDTENSQDKVISNGSQDEVRIKRFEFHKGSDFDRLPLNKLNNQDDEFRDEHRVFDKYKSFEVRLKDDDYVRESYERTEESEEEEEVQNLCLKEKSYQCENFDDLAKAERDSSGLENVLHGDAGRMNIQNFSSHLFRGSHGIISSRSYPVPFETESVDLSVRPSFSSSPIYTLDLTPSRVELSGRSLDFRNHLGLPPFRFGSPTGGMTSESGQMSPTNYGSYQYTSPGQRTCQGSPFQPYSYIYN